MLSAAALLLASAAVLAACSSEPVVPTPAPSTPTPIPRPPGVVVLPTAPWATATPWPTFTPVATPWPTVAFTDFVFSEHLGPTPVVLPDGSVVIPATASPPRLDCTVHFRNWLPEHLPVESARHLVRRVEEFRIERPDCVIGKFEPLFSAAPVCFDEDRVAGVRVARGLRRGIDYNHNLRLGPTASDSYGNLLIHFDRLPTSLDRACWYYHAASRTWYQQVVGGSPAAVGPGATAAPQPTVAPGLVASACDRELQSHLLSVQSLDHLVVDDISLQVETGLGACSLDWRPSASPGPVIPACPAQDTGIYPGGTIIVHWATSPDDGSSCWIFDPVLEIWASR